MLEVNTSYFFRILFDVLILVPLLFKRADVPGKMLLATIIFPDFSSSLMRRGIFSG
jgi:hypothetical protein